MKRIITCNDGTWNKPDTVDDGAGVMTNVEKIYKCITPHGHNGEDQVKFYDEGVGTGPGFWNKLVGGVAGAGIDKNIKDTYKFIMWNYTGLEDEIFMFGFSRGAYTARSLAGLIRNCGILKPENLHLVDEAYELYRDRTTLAHPDSDAMVSFRKQYSYNGIEQTKIKCIGVWDTVGALGIPLHFFQLANQERYKFHDVTLSSWVKNAFHALSIDERRKIFSPTLWQMSSNMNPVENHMEQVWFSGVHANIGGGYKQNGLSDITLDWMIEKVSSLGLHIDKRLLKDDSTQQRAVQIRPILKGFMRDSISDFWIYRLQKARWRIMFYERDPENPSKLCLDKAGHRIIAHDSNEMLHASAYDRFIANFDKRISPYLRETAGKFVEEGKIDTTANNEIDRICIEPKDAGDELMKGIKKRKAK